MRVFNEEIILEMSKLTQKYADEELYNFCLTNNIYKF